MSARNHGLVVLLTALVIAAIVWWFHNDIEDFQSVKAYVLLFVVAVLAAFALYHFHFWGEGNTYKPRSRRK